MEKIWSIDGKDFTNREEAKKFLATAWKENRLNIWMTMI